MPERDYFPKRYFEANPFERASLTEIYERVQWGNEPDHVREIEAPEAMVKLGDMKLMEIDGAILEWDEGEAVLAIGQESNLLYIIPVDVKEIPVEGYEPFGEVFQTDYLSTKGGDDGHYYHEHEEPYPYLVKHDSGVMVLLPSLLEDGSRSYAVGEEGIIG